MQRAIQQLRQVQELRQQSGRVELEIIRYSFREFSDFGVEMGGDFEAYSRKVKLNLLRS